MLTPAWPVVRRTWNRSNLVVTAAVGAAVARIVTSSCMGVKDDPVRPPSTDGTVSTASLFTIVATEFCAAAEPVPGTPRTLVIVPPVGAATMYFALVAIVDGSTFIEPGAIRNKNVPASGTCVGAETGAGICWENGTTSWLHVTGIVFG